MPSIAEILSSVKTSLIPALVVLIATFCSTIFQTFDQSYLQLYNVLFYILIIATLIVLGFTSQKKQIFFILLLFAFYITLNKTRSQTSQSDFSFICSSLFLLCPLNLFYLLSKKQFSQTQLFYVFLFWLFQGVLVERFAFVYHFNFPENMLFISYLAWFILLIYMLLKISFYPSFRQTGIFFAMLCFGLSLLNATDVFSFVIYNLAAIFIVLYANLHALLYAYYKDEIIGVYSKNTFYAHDAKKFPPKYSMAFFDIDNYNKLFKVFGKASTDRLTEMIIEKVYSKQPEVLIYRNKPHEFILVFTDFDVKQTYEAMEDIRRLIAGTEFVFLKNKSVKLTITPVVSEKRRSDADANAVLMRMHENFHQKYRFTQNMTFCEEIESAKKIRRTPSKF